MGDGTVVAVPITGQTLADFVSGEGFAPGAGVRLSPDGDAIVIVPEAPRGDPCQSPPGIRDRQNQETICGVLLSRDGATLELQTPDGVRTVRLLRDAHIHVLEASGLTLADLAEGDAAVGHGIQVTGHVRGDFFLVGLVIVGPEVDGAAPRR
jgi:hypothetical protein